MVSSYVRHMRFLWYMLFSEIPTFLSLNRLEKKKNVALAIDAFALFRQGLTKAGNHVPLGNSRLVVGGGYDPRVEENMMTLFALIGRTKSASLSYNIVSPSFVKDAHTAFQYYYQRSRHSFPAQSHHYPVSRSPYCIVDARATIYACKRTLWHHAGRSHIVWSVLADRARAR